MGLLIRVVHNIPGVVAVFLIAAAIFLSVPASASSSDYPHRIVSLGPLNTENVFLLGAGGRLVGDTIYCVRPPEARNREKVGTLMEINLEKIVALKPDIVLATGLTQPRDLYGLRRLGLRVVRFEKPDSFNALCSHLLRLGELLGCGKEARTIVKQVRRKVQCISDACSGFSRQSVFLQVGANPLFASVNDSFTDDYIRLGGGKNIVADQLTGHASLEKVLAMDPDVIIIAIMGTETGIAARERKRWMRFRQMKAVKAGRVHTVNPDIICSPSPVTFVKALAVMAGLIHPEATEIMERLCGVSASGME